MLKSFVYTCNSCGHSWEDARPAAYADVPTKFPCSECKKVDISFAAKKRPKGQPGVFSIADPVRIGVTKTDNGFKEVLQKIKSTYPGSTIKID